MYILVEYDAMQAFNGGLSCYILCKLRVVSIPGASFEGQLLKTIIKPLSIQMRVSLHVVGASLSHTIG